MKTICWMNNLRSINFNPKNVEDDANIFRFTYGAKPFMTESMRVNERTNERWTELFLKKSKFYKSSSGIFCAGKFVAGLSLKSKQFLKKLSLNIMWKVEQNISKHKSSQFYVNLHLLNWTVIVPFVVFCCSVHRALLNEAKNLKFPKTKNFSSSSW